MVTRKTHFQALHPSTPAAAQSLKLSRGSGPQGNILNSQLQTPLPKGGGAQAMQLQWRSDGSGRGRWARTWLGDRTPPTLPPLAGPAQRWARPAVGRPELVAPSRQIKLTGPWKTTFLRGSSKALSSDACARASPVPPLDPPLQQLWRQDAPRTLGLKNAGVMTGAASGGIGRYWEPFSGRLEQERGRKHLDYSGTHPSFLHAHPMDKGDFQTGQNQHNTFS